MIVLKQKSDLLGTYASTLCLIHCLATPLLFIAQSCTVTCCEATPVWWKSIDYLFLVISCLAIYWSTTATSLKWIKKALWLSWCALAFVIINEKVALLPLPEASIYIPAIALIGLHLYNRNYCKCNTATCCTKSISN